ncbi:glycosyl hydrolase family 61-domain-containing protein [Phyllosticta paracitricarpa]|uniref:AA9 family lytic polysaccharide monooxygenase n=2 Tax=Phyllosticta TaxID=121621 RepID=A0ABR1M2J8_9PEZI
MKTAYGALALAATAKLACAHATVFAAWINDVDQGLGNSDSGYIRSPPNNDPIKDVTSTDMTCNVNNVETAKTLKVAPGDKVTFEWHHNSRDSSDDIIASSHKGPVMTYMAEADKGGNGNGWVKLAEDGYSDGTWAVDTLISNKGKHSITIPEVTPGNYLLRPEIIALHEASNEGGAQFYLECVQISVSGSGTTSLPEGVALPGAYKADDAGILFNMYGDFSTYQIPGPTVWDGASSGASATGAASVAATSAAASTPVAATSAAAVVQSSSAVVQSSSTVAAVATPSVSAPAEDDEDYDCDDETEATSSAVAVAATSAAASTPVTTPAAVTPSSAAAAGGNYVSTTTETVFVSNIETTTVTVTAGAVGAASTPSSVAGTLAKKYEACSSSTDCEEGSTCKTWNNFYSQCV